MGKFHPSPHLLAWVGPLLSYKFASGAQINQTIDDTLGDSSTSQLVTYTRPTNSSFSRWADQTCQGCAILPSDPSLAFKETFHGATYDPSAAVPISFQLDFAGTAIYVFFTLVNNVDTFVNFSMDNTPAGSFTYNANTNPATLYQVPVFSRTNLQNSQHSLLVSAAPSSVFSYVNFDYAMYTQDDGTPEPLPGTPFLTSTSQPSSTIPLFTHRSKQHRSKTTSFNETQSSAPSTVVQPTTTTTLADTASNPFPKSSMEYPPPTTSSTSGLVGAARHTGPTHLAIIGAVLGPVFAVVAAGLLLRSARPRNRENSKQQDPILSTEAQPEDSSFQDLAIPVTPPEGKLKGSVSALFTERFRYILRRTRQTEIDRRLRTLCGEIVEISSKLSARGAMAPANGGRLSADQQHVAECTGDESTSSERLRRMLSTKRRQIEHLEQQRLSPWALGFGEESPLEDAGAVF